MTKLDQFVAAKEYMQLVDLVAVGLGCRLRFTRRLLFGYVPVTGLVVGFILIFVKP